MRVRVLFLTAVDVELRGVPAHAWETSTAQVLLGGSCLVHAPLVDTASRRDLSAFSVLAWAVQLDSIPPLVNLIIPELAPVHAELPAVRRGLLYKVQVSLLSSRDAVGDPHSSAPISPEQGRRRRRWRCHRRSPSPLSPYSGDATGHAAPTGMTPVHSRLGSGVRHAPPDTPTTDVDVVMESSGGFPSPVPQALASSFHEREAAAWSERKILLQILSERCRYLCPPGLTLLRELLCKWTSTLLLGMLVSAWSIASPRVPPSLGLLLLPRRWTVACWKWSLQTSVQPLHSRAPSQQP
jgi:hypothetical protein